MTRMSEVFELPLSYVDVAEFTVNLTKDEVKAVQLSVNHVDALADALEMLMDWNVKNVTIEHHPIYDIAHSALAAYRGGK